MSPFNAKGNLRRLKVVLMMGIAVLLVSSLASAEEAKEGEGEYRMAWVLTFEGELLSSREGIKKVVEVCRENNLNAVVPVVRRRGRAYYDSKIEPKYHPDPEKLQDGTALRRMVWKYELYLHLYHHYR